MGIMDKIKYLPLVVILSLLIITTGVSAAQPILPDRFYGTVKLAGIDAPVGTRIDIRLSDNYLKSYELEDAGIYTIYVAEGVAGYSINFLIKGVPVGASIRTGGLQNLNLSLSPTGSLSQNLTSENRTMDFHGKDIVSTYIEITTKTDVVNESITVSLYEDTVFGGFTIGDNESHIKSITVDMNSSIVDYAFLKIYYTPEGIKNFNKDSLRIYFYNESAGDWEPILDQGVNVDDNYVWANVTHLSTYGLFGMELYCGDGTCSPEIGEICSSCQADCGTCTSTGGYTPPGGGAYIPSCYENWTCSAWSICSQDGSQVRVCNDANTCGTEREKPAETQTCTYTPPQLPAVCNPGVKVCAGDDLMECSEGNNWVRVETCEHGCSVDKCVIDISPDGSEGTGETGTGMVGYFIDNPATLYGMIILIIVIVAAGAYWRLRKTRKTI